MKAKLLRRIRKNWFIGITDDGTYALVQKRGYASSEWYGLENFYAHILQLVGLTEINAWNIIEVHLAKRERQYLLNKISR